MAMIFDFVLKYYSPIEKEGRLIMSNDQWNQIASWARHLANEKLLEFLGFGDKVTIEPLREECYLMGQKLPMNGYKVMAGGCEHLWRIEPRIRERKSQAWRGL